MLTRHRHCATSQLHAGGMTLVEVLISLVVISVGLLGVAALQISSLRSTQGSYLRTQATALAQDIADRMRANRTAALAGTYNMDIGTTVTLGGSPSRADRDKYEWKQSIKNELPTAPDGTVADGSVAIAGNVVTITIQWGERGTATNSNKSASAVAAYAIQFVTRTEI